ncbi:hypothetical protein AWB76_07886 [Caballeronia temeraria]|uniref:Uncharacterized protein n=1 Tax=Caballeronia temeraria TaxID=1777137 RepID=A0A158E3D0_9BURK|nr:hypothetical protein AWB76_07886 [Caballeronia temeraria]
MGAAQIGRVDGAKMVRQRRAQHAGVDQLGDPDQNMVLFDHVRGLVHRAGVHQFPVQRDALGLQDRHVERLGVVDQPKLALRRQHLGDSNQVLVGMGQARHVIYRVNAKAAQLRRHRLRVVDHMVCTELAHPLLCFRPRRGGHHGQAGQLARQLDQYGADAAGAANDEQHSDRVFSFAHLQTVEQQLPRRDRGQRQRGCFFEAEALRHRADDALVDQVQLAVGARP